MPFGRVAGGMRRHCVALYRYVRIDLYIEIPAHRRARAQTHTCASVQAGATLARTATAGARTARAAEERAANVRRANLRRATQLERDYSVAELERLCGFLGLPSPRLASRQDLAWRLAVDCPKQCDDLIAAASARADMQVDPPDRCHASLCW